jgi:hypothetical protein
MKTTDEERFAKLESLEDGWFDGEWGKPINPKAIQLAKTFIKVTGCTTHAIFPTENGGVQIEWLTEKDCVCVEFYSDDTLDIMGEVFVLD